MLADRVSLMVRAVAPALGLDGNAAEGIAARPSATAPAIRSGLPGALSHLAAFRL